MDGQNRKNIRPGITVDIVLKADQPTGKLTRGVVARILTSSGVHSRGIKVRLTGGQVGRVQNIVDTASAEFPASPQPFRNSGRREKGRSRGRAGTKDLNREPRVQEQRFEGPFKKSACDCCGFATLEKKNAYETCPVCYWEDDAVQRENSGSSMGSNHISLNDARRNFAALGACEARYVKAVRKPAPEELPV